MTIEEWERNKDLSTDFARQMAIEDSPFEWEDALKEHRAGRVARPSDYEYYITDPVVDEEGNILLSMEDMAKELSDLHAAMYEELISGEDEGGPTLYKRSE